MGGGVILYITTGVVQLPDVEPEKRQGLMTPGTTQSSFGSAMPMAVTSSRHKNYVQWLVS